MSDAAVATDQKYVTLSHAVLWPVLLLAGAALDCWSARVIWRWFMLPTLGAWRGDAVFYGAWFIAHILTHQMNSRETDGKTPAEKLAASISWSLLRPPTVVGCAWIVLKAFGL